MKQPEYNIEARILFGLYLILTALLALSCIGSFVFFPEDKDGNSYWFELGKNIWGKLE
jgi:hypothetical protein